MQVAFRVPPSSTAGRPIVLPYKGPKYPNSRVSRSKNHSEHGVFGPNTLLLGYLDPLDYSLIKLHVLWFCFDVGEYLSLIQSALLLAVTTTTHCWYPLKTYLSRILGNCTTGEPLLICRDYRTPKEYMVPTSSTTP